MCHTTPQTKLIGPNAQAARVSIHVGCTLPSTHTTTRRRAQTHLHRATTFTAAVSSKSVSAEAQTQVLHEHTTRENDKRSLPGFHTAIVFE